MSPYAYSLNGEDYQGSFATREAAAEAGIAAARLFSEPPTTVFVGRLIPCDSGARGHARAVLSQLVSRHREGANDIDPGYLTHLSNAPVDELDGELERTILAWLDKHQLTPSLLRVVAVSEHPLPPVPENHVFASTCEVHNLGVEV
jgi:hypothetical protein